MLIAPHRKGHRVVPKVLKGARGKVAAPSDARYVLTELHAALANAVLHATVGAPTFAVRHDHLTDFTNVGTKTHAQIDSHIADGTKHFLYGTIDHDTIVNTHNLTTDIDHDQLTNFLATEHFLEGAIDHTNILNIGTNTHADIDTHIADGTIHFLEGAIDHTAILNIGTKTHAQIDTHIALVNEHLDWTNTSVAFSTTGSATAGRLMTTSFVATDEVKSYSTNADLYLNPDGTGLVKFGAYEAAEVQIVGYIEMKDAAGNTRKLAVAR